MSYFRREPQNKSIPVVVPAVSMHAYTFRTFERADLPLVERWLHAPENVRWRGDPDVEFESLEEDLDEPNMRQWIVACDGRDFAYVQAYAIDSWPQAHLAHLPPGTIALDTFIGEPDMLGCGHGGSYLRTLAKSLIEQGAPLIAIDPTADNRRARRAYARAGFVGDSIVVHGDARVVVMTFADQPELTTVRLRLEPLMSRHASRTFASLKDERIYRYLQDRPPISVDALRERYRRLESRLSPDASERWLNWIIAPRERPDDALGYVQATVRGSSASVGYVLFVAAQGRGFAVEAVGAVVDYLATCGLAEVRAEIDVRNIRSQRVVETLGFERIAAVKGDGDNVSVSEDLVYAKVLSHREASPSPRVSRS